jgi:multidrug efflux system membrane fusion protein
MAVVTQLQPISVVFTIPQDDIVRVQQRVNTGQTLVVEAYDRDFKTKLGTGSLLALDNQVDPSTGTVRLKAVFKNKDYSLFPNQFVNARLLVDTKRDATIVPAAAVQRGPNSNFVYVVKPDETVALRDVTVGPTGDGDRMAIESGISLGDVVVTGGVDKLQPGTKVVARNPQRSRQRGTAGEAENSAMSSPGQSGPGDIPAGPAATPGGPKDMPSKPGGGVVAKRPT